MRRWSAWSGLFFCVVSFLELASSLHDDCTRCPLDARACGAEKICRLYTQGGPEGPDPLLKALRGEIVDWAAIEAKHAPSRVCSGYGMMHFKDEFAVSQWKCKDERHFCKVCVTQKTEDERRHTV